MSKPLIERHKHDFDNFRIAARKRIGLYEVEAVINTETSREQGGSMETVRSLNFLMICAAFVFIGAMVVGVIS